MNAHDSERMKGMLESLGYAEAEARADADLILFNTCSIREKADERFVAHLGEARALKRRDPDHAVGTLALEPFGLAQVRDEPVVGVLADRAGVEQDQVGLVAGLGLAVAERLEHPLHPLGIVLIHLAPERGEVVALHRSQG